MEGTASVTDLANSAGHQSIARGQIASRKPLKALVDNGSVPRLQGQRLGNVQLQATETLRKFLCGLPAYDLNDGGGWFDFLCDIFPPAAKGTLQRDGVVATYGCYDLGFVVHRAGLTLSRMG